MPTYKYMAKNIQNKKTEGVIYAKDLDRLYTALKAEGLILLSYEEEKKAENTYKLKSSELSEFSKQLGDMIGGGITIVKAMEIISERASKPKTKAVFERIYGDVQRGVSLSSAMSNIPNAFPQFFVNMYKSAEESGSIDEVSLDMAEYYSRDNKIEGKIKIAMMYPAFLAGVTVCVVLGVFIGILPPFFKMFNNMGIEMPLITKIVLAISNFLVKYGIYLMIIALMAILLAKLLLEKPKIREYVDKKKLTMPIVGKFLVTIYTARFAGAISALYHGGIDMGAALDITGNIVGNEYLKSNLKKVANDIRGGSSLSQSLETVDGFDSKLMTFVYVGQESGRLDSMLKNLADNFQYESENAIEKLISVVNPIMIIIMALIIGCIMLAVMMPIISMYKSMG